MESLTAREWQSTGKPAADGWRLIQRIAGCKQAKRDKTIPVAYRPSLHERSAAPPDAGDLQGERLVRPDSCDQLPRKITDSRKPTGAHMSKATMTISIGLNMVIPSTLVDIHSDYTFMFPARNVPPGQRRPLLGQCPGINRGGLPTGYGDAVEFMPSSGSSRPLVRGPHQQTCPQGHGVGGFRIWRDL